MNSKVKLPTNIKGVHGDVNMFTSVKDSRCDKGHFDRVSYNTGMTIDAGELMNIIIELSHNTSQGLDGLTAEHIKFADSQLYSGVWLYTKINHRVCYCSGYQI